MISYDQYENKIKKFAKFRNVLKRFRFLFIAIFALLIAAAATLLVLKGSFSGEIKIASSVYGEEFADPEGVSAFLSSVSYEYAIEGSDEWNSRKPVKAGKYTVRAVSDKTVGKGYGKSASFEIKPREVVFTIESDSVEYGGIPEKTSLLPYTEDAVAEGYASSDQFSGLVSGDTLDRGALLFLYDDYASERTGVDLDGSSVKIMNGSDDRSACYVVRHEKKELEITKRSISVSLGSEKFVYNGAAVVYSRAVSESTALRLAHGDEIRIGSVQLQQNGSEIDSAVYAGNYEALVGEFRIYKVIGGTETDVTNQYSAEIPTVSFEIEKRPLTVRTASAVKEYDGAALSRADGLTVTGLAEDDGFTVHASSSVTNAQTGVRNEITSFTITSRKETDVKDNYDIVWEYGTLTVLPRKITVTSPDGRWEYDGAEKSLVEITFSDELFEAVVDGTASHASVLRVGTVSNSIGFLIKNSETGNEEDKSNFDITTRWGTLEITRRDITLTISDVSKLYDGQPLFTTVAREGEVSVTSGSLGAGDSLADGTLYGLTNVHTEEGEVGEIENRSEYKILAADGERTDCYNIKYVRGVLRVDPRHIRIITNSREFIYDGAAHSDGGYTYKVYDEKGLETPFTVQSGSITLKSAPAFTNVAETRDQTENNVCEYNVSTNYTVDGFTYGTVTVLPRALIVTTNSNTFVYDGESHSDNGYTARHEGGAGLIGQDILSCISFRTFENVADTAGFNNVCEYAVPNDNYLILNTVPGTIQILPREIYVVTDSDEKIFDGEPLSKNEYIKTYHLNGGTEEAGLIGEDKLTLDKAYSIINVKDSGDNACEFKVPNGNYEIVGYDCGTLTIIPRSIRVVTGSAEKEYDGGELSRNEYVKTYRLNGEAEEAGLIGGDALELSKPYSIINVKETGENLCEFKVPNTNYTIAGYDRGTLEVKPRAVSIALGQVIVAYGEEIVFPTTGDGNFSILDGSFVGEDTMEIFRRFDFSAYGFEEGDRIPVRWIVSGEGGYQVGFYDDAIVVDRVSFTGSDPGNYSFSYVKGDVTVRPRQLNVNLRNAETFYGESLGEKISGADGSSDYYSVGEVYRSGVGNYTDVYFVDIFSDETDMSKQGLIDGDTLEIVGIRYWDDLMPNPDTEDGQPQVEHFVDPRDAGLYYIKPYRIMIRYADGREEFTFDETQGEPYGNYRIPHYVPGRLSVKPRPIEVTLNKIETDYYDGQAREYPSGGERVVRGSVASGYEALLKKEDGLVYGDRLNVNVVFDQEPVFAGKYTYSFDPETSSVVNAEGKTVGLNNYKIACENGLCEITKRPVTIRMNDLELVYGEYVSYHGGGNYTVVGEIGFVEGERIYEWADIDYGCGERPSVGEYVIMGYPQGINYHLSERPPIIHSTDSYEIEVLPGKLTIVPKDVRVQMAKNISRYGADFERSFRQSLRYSELAYDETLQFILTYLQNEEEVTPRNIGIYDVKLTPVHSAGEAGLKNYNISYWDAINQVPMDGCVLRNALQIDPLLVSIHLGSKEINYGEAIGEISITLNPGLPYADEKFSCAIVFKKSGEIVVPKYADVYDIDVEDIRINGGTEGLKNYDFRYESKKTLTIKPLKITVALDPLSIVYGDPVQYASGTDGTDYTIEKDGLVYGDELYVTPVFELTGTSETRPDTGAYMISTGTYTVFFEDSEYSGEYFVADSYDITFVTATLEVRQRLVRVQLARIFTEYNYYDGKAHYYEPGASREEVIENMAEGEELVMTIKYFYSADGRESYNEVDAIGKAGYYRYEFAASESAVKNGGLKGIANYAFMGNAMQRTTRLYSRLISINLLSIRDTIYGTPVSYPDGGGNYESVTPFLPAVGGLVAGEELEISVVFRNEGGKSFDNNAVLPVGTYTIYNSDVAVTGGVYADIANYQISYERTSFKVLPRAVTITPLHITAEYGEKPDYPVEAGNYESAYGLAEGEVLTVQEVEFLVDRPTVGEYEKKIRIVSILITRDGKDVTENYSEVVNNGDFTVVPREVIVFTADNTFVYDGEKHSDGGYKIVYAKDSSMSGLVYGDTSAISAEYKNNLPSVTEYSETATQNKFGIVIQNGDTNVMENYSVAYRYGDISITRRQIFVTTKSYEKVYDGTPLVSKNEVEECYHYLNNDPAREKVEGLVLDQRFTVKTVSITDFGEIENDNITDIVNTEGESKIYNYEIVKTFLGKMKVYQRILYVDGPSAEKVYDGTPLNSPAECTVSYYPDNDLTLEPIVGDGNVLVLNHRFMKSSVSVTDVDTIENNPYVGINANGEYMSGNPGEGNYEIRHRSGYLSVTRRRVSYRVGDLTMTYRNGAPLEDAEHFVEQQNGDRGVLSGEAGTFTYAIRYLYDPNIPDILVTRFNVGQYYIVLDTEERNYYFDQGQNGILTVNKASLTLRPADKWAIYTNANQRITLTANDLIAAGLAQGDVIADPGFNRTSLSASENKVSATVKILLDNVVIRDINSNDSVKDNYEITTQLGFVGFTARTLFVEQIVPDYIRKTATGRGQLDYTGARQNIEGGDELFRVLTASEAQSGGWTGTGSFNASTYGLLASDTAKLRSAYVPKGVQVNSQWVRLDIDSRAGNAVTKLYNIVYVNRTGRESSIEVLPIQAKVSFGSMLTQEYIDGLGNGINVLDPSFIESTENLWEGNLLEAAVYKNEEGVVSVYIFIYLPRYDESGKINYRADRSTLYAVTAVFAEKLDLGVECVNSAIYPKSE